MRLFKARAIGTWNSGLAKDGREAVKREFRLSPAADHIDPDKFVALCKKVVLLRK